MVSDKETVWLDEAHAYTVTTVHGELGRPEQSGLSHVEAMRVAEGLWRGGEMAVVMHVIGDKRYEVDRYPAR